MKSLFSAQGKIARREFAITGLILFAVKYNLDRFIAMQFEKSWFITDYFMQADHLSVSSLSYEEKKFYFFLVILSFPFIWMGTALCLRRLRDASLPMVLVALFFVPLLNIFIFLMLCIMPSADTNEKTNVKPYFLQKIIPESETGSILFSIAVTVIIALAFSTFSVSGLKEYGWGLFIGIPFFIGFCSVLLYSYHQHPISFKKALGIGLTSISIFAIMLFALAMEGAICIIMAAPIGYAVGIIGSALGYAIQFHQPKATLNSIGLYLVVIPLVMLLEQKENSETTIHELKTGVVINQPAEIVWNQLVNFSTIDPPEELIFKTGIAYPIDAKISGRGVGAIRNCNFTTGSFIEPITVWDEPNLLKFDVQQQPQPMFEMSFYQNVRALHLDGYFISQRGQFKLTQQGDKKTLLEGTTWYQNKMWPAAYWKPWSDFILHQIHYRVLNHIKKESEDIGRK